MIFRSYRLKFEEKKKTLDLYVDDSEEKQINRQGTLSPHIILTLAPFHHFTIPLLSVQYEPEKEQKTKTSTLDGAHRQGVGSVKASKVLFSRSRVLGLETIMQCHVGLFIL